MTDRLPDPVEPAGELLGIRVIESDAGRAVLRLIPRPEHLNGAGLVHGGVIFLLADTALALAVRSTGAVGITASADTVFVAAAHAGEELEAVGRIVSGAGRSVVVDATVRRGDVVVAEVRGVLRLAAQPPAAQATERRAGGRR